VKPTIDQGMEAAEQDEIAADVNADIAAGDGEKHFQDLFDSLLSTQGSAEAVDHDLRDRLERFAAAFRVGLSDQLRGNARGLMCVGVNLDGHGKGFICKFRDQAGRLFTVDVSYDDGFAAAAVKGASEMGRGMLDLVLDRLIQAHERYFERMQS